MSDFPFRASAVQPFESFRRNENTEEMTFDEASEYLDWLECHGENSKEVIVMADGRVIVRETDTVSV